MTNRASVFLADDHSVLRAGLRLLIDGEADLQVVGETGTAADVTRKVLETKPDVLVLDLAMPGGGGLRALRDVRELSPATRVVVLSMYDDRGYVRSALEAGARAYVTKRSADMALLDAIRAVLKGESYVDESLACEPLRAVAGVAEGTEASSAPGIAALSAREREVFDLVVTGHTNREVAERLGVGVKSVETYRARVFEKLGFKTRAELVHYAIEIGVLSKD